MANTKITDKPVGSIVTSRIDGRNYNFVIVHHGKPSDSYDDSCDGTWLMINDCFSLEQYGESPNYKDSYINIVMNREIIKIFENGLKGVVKPVKIPYTNDSGTVMSGSNGFATNLFLLSATEVGLTVSDFQAEGAALDYFADGSSENRIANYNGSPYAWALRTPVSPIDSNVISINAQGNKENIAADSNTGIRFAFVVYSSCMVDDDDKLVPYIAPIITSTTAVSGSNLGVKSSTFNLNYTVTTQRPDLTLEITEIISGTNVIKTKKVINSGITSGNQRTFSLIVNDSDEFFKLMNGEKTLTVQAKYSDYNNSAVESVSEYYVTFDKEVKTVTLTLKNPMTVSGNITRGYLKIDGNIPDDASYTVQVTNNNSTWKNVTTNVKQGSAFTFSTSGKSFNFKVQCTRGSSDASGYISGIAGAFE